MSNTGGGVFLCLIYFFFSYTTVMVIDNKVKFMTGLMERDFSLRFRAADPNRDRHQDSHPHIGRVVFEEGIQGEHIKKTSVRRLPTLGQILRVANGVNSRSAVVFHAVFDPAKFSF